MLYNYRHTIDRKIYILSGRVILVSWCWRMHTFNSTIPFFQGPEPQTDMLGNVWTVVPPGPRAGAKRHVSQSNDCPVCHKTYQHSKDLIRHMVLHSGERFLCNFCGRLFTRKDKAKKHVDTFHEGIDCGISIVTHSKWPIVIIKQWLRNLDIRGLNI